MTTEEMFMQRAVALSREALHTQGTAPFGAVIVRDGEIVGEGLNHAAGRHDPTSHGEVEAIRDACRRLETTSLDGCDLYTSCEPCALCVAAMRIAGIRKLFYAASLAEAGPTLARRLPSIDVADLRAEAGATVEARRMPSARIGAAAAVAVLAEWAAQPGEAASAGRIAR